jgi:hypothetical protein
MSMRLRVQISTRVLVAHARCECTREVTVASHKAGAGEDGYSGNMCMAPWADNAKPMLRLPTVNGFLSILYVFAHNQPSKSPTYSAVQNPLGPSGSHPLVAVSGAPDELLLLPEKWPHCRVLQWHAVIAVKSSASVRSEVGPLLSTRLRQPTSGGRQLSGCSQT